MTVFLYFCWGVRSLGLVKSHHCEASALLPQRAPLEVPIKSNELSSYVIGPQGTILTPADLPPTNIKRWTAYRKAEIIAAIRGGLLSLEDACRRYSLTAEEFVSWQRLDQERLCDRLRAHTSRSA